MNIVVSYTRPSWPGGSLLLAEPVQVGDMLRVGRERQFDVGVVQVGGEGPYDVVVGNPYGYGGFDSIPRYVIPGEPVEVIGHIGRQEER